MIIHTHTKTIVSFTMSIILIILFSVSISYAQSDEVKSARERVTESTDELIEFKKESPEDEKERVVREIQLKRNALRDVLVFTMTETESVYKKLFVLDIAEPEFLLLQEELLETLGGYSEFLTLLEGELQALFTLEEIEEFAESFGEWRGKVYEPEIKKAIELNLVFQNQKILNTADSRFGKISTYLKREKSLELTRGLWESLIEEAARDIKDARMFYVQARETLLSFLSEEEGGVGGLLEDEKILKEKENMNERAPEELLLADVDIQEDKEQTVTELVRMSFEKVKEAYTEFIEIIAILKG